jgi:asparagine synthase (glutamine-hydrolysing)
MCGIAGIVDLQASRPIDRTLLHRMNESLQHRGPDDSGLHIEPGVGLGHRRLAIIDRAGGQQPLANEDQSVIVVYNGEIYNFQTLTQTLINAGHVFRTHGDTEVIVHAWEEWGERCVEYFRGMFAFALWDRRQQRLFLARDRLGIKPLHYAFHPDGYVLFASEMKALLADTSLPRTLDLCAVEDYFTYGYIPEPRSIFTQIIKLAPGHSLTLTKQAPTQPSPRQYWDLSFQSNGLRNLADATEELIARFREAVQIRLIAEVPLGAFLSGGVDSSAVVAMMAGLSSQPVNTCSMAFGESAFNETEFANQVATRYHTHHLVQSVDVDNFSLLARLPSIYDEPYADSSAIPTYRICELAKKRVTVCLSGDGGDELFAGYQRHRWHHHEEQWRRRLPQWLRGPSFGAISSLYPSAQWLPPAWRLKETLRMLAYPTLEAYGESIAIVGQQQRKAMFSKSFRQGLQGYRALEVLQRHAQSAPDHPLSRVQYLDCKTYLPGDILTKVDRASMAHGLEVRVPLLDHEFLGWATGLPPEWCLNGKEGKWIFKKALEPYLDANTLYRRKMGFAVPLATWFRGPLRDQIQETLLGETLASTGWFNQRWLQKVVTVHQTGQQDLSATIWSLLMFERFYQSSVVTS